MVGLDCRISLLIKKINFFSDYPIAITKLWIDDNKL